MNLKYSWITGEPDLHDMLHDDVVMAVMRRDGVSRQDLHDLLGRVRSRLNHGHGTTVPHRSLPRPANDALPLSRS
jgi:hypothetical protein